MNSLSDAKEAYLQRRWVTKGLSELSSNLVLGRKIDLLEELRGDRETASSPNSLQCVLGVHVVVEMVAF